MKVKLVKIEFRNKHLAFDQGTIENGIQSPSGFIQTFWGDNPIKLGHKDKLEEDGILIWEYQEQ